MDNPRYVKHLRATGEFAKAKEFLRHALKNGAENGMMWLTLAEIYFGEQEFRSACNAYEWATTLVPLPTSAQTRLAYCYIRTRKRTVAETILEFLAERRRSLSLPELQLITNSAMRIRNFNILEPISAEGLERFPRLGLFWFAAGEAARQSGAGEKAGTCYARAVELCPHNMSYRIALCRQQLVSSDHEAARKTLRLVVSDVRCLANLQRIQRLYRELNDDEGVFACQSELTRWYYRKSSEFDLEP